MAAIEFTEEIVQASFGSWMFSLFSEIGLRNPGLSLAHRKTAFFFLVEALLAGGLIKFIAPGADCYVSPAKPHPRLTIHDAEAHWDASSREIVERLTEMWPESVSDEGDEALLIYFYEIPGVIWVDGGRGYVSGD